jgi:hypothetical protein
MVLKNKKYRLPVLFYFYRRKQKIMLKTFSVIFLSGIIALIAGCSSAKKNRSSIEVTGSWVNKEKASGKSYNSVFILVLTENLETRTVLENDLANAAKTNGIKAVKSLAVFGPVTATKDTAVIASLMRKIKEKECETILTVSLVDSKSETKYIPGSSYSYNPMAYYGPYYGTFAGYYSYAATSFYSPGYYNTNSTYYLETNLYDAIDQAILFSIQTKAMNPPEINKASTQFTTTLIDELKKNGLLKKRS